MVEFQPMTGASELSASQESLLSLLADGRFHSGQALALALGLSRGAVWKQIQSLQARFGVDIHAVRGRGYRLPVPLELLQPDRIAEEVGAEASTALQALHVLRVTDSTNSRALADPPLQRGHARVWVAEHQSGGRGRRGRPWATGFGQGVALSLAWRFDLPMNDLAPLSLVAGIAVADALRAFGADDVSLKWPNDVLVGDRKLCGILVEATGEANGPVTAVIGLGINVRLSGDVGAKIDQPWIDLAGIGLGDISRNALTGRLIRELVSACKTFSDARLQPFLERWGALDGLHGQVVDVVRGNVRTSGIYRGVAADGALCLEQAGQLIELHAGEVSLRPTATT